MQNIFDYDNSLMSTIAKVADAVTLGVLWAVCSLPVFTVGAASAAFYYAYNKCIRKKQDYAWKTFFTAFKSNFKQATQLWLLVLAVLAVAIADCYLLSLITAGGFLLSLMQMLCILLFLAGCIWMLYLFPYLSRFENPTKRAMKNAALIALANVSQSILLLFLFSVCVIGAILLPLLNLFIPTLYMVFAIRILEPIFQKYMPPESKDV